MTSLKKSPLKTQVGGDHYKNLAIQPAEYITHNGFSFLVGCIIKRISRYDRSSGKGLEDLEKIKHEVDLIIELEGWGKSETPRYLRVLGRKAWDFMNRVRQVYDESGHFSKGGDRVDISS